MLPNDDMTRAGAYLKDRNLRDDWRFEDEVGRIHGQGSGS